MLDKCVEKFNSLDFIENDPISIPHQYSKKQDIEITGFWTAMLSWGQRKTIINKANELFQLMDNAPYDFIVNHVESDRKKFLKFKHRTFQVTDTLYFLEFFQHYYRANSTLEDAFLTFQKPFEIESSLNGFHQNFFGLDEFPQRTKKHVSCPAKKSTCKRLNMFLRWMVRKDENQVDFGLWNQLKMSDLMIPLDIHVGNVARSLGLLQRKQNDWKSVMELTNVLKTFDSEDPVRYDYALFSLGINKIQNLR
jgi:uncharacterized protein (TIGR02757 family)